jgi:hypothetical protein
MTVTNLRQWPEQARTGVRSLMRSMLMSTAYVVVTLLAAALVAFSAGSVFSHAKFGSWL